MARLTRISLVRHGEVHNPGNILYGRLPRFRLNAKGEESAERAALVLRKAPLQAVFSSPLLRARQTAAFILRCHPSARLRLSSLITEVDTPYEGMSRSEIEAVSGNIYRNGGDRGELPEDVLKRGLQFLTGVRKNYSGGHVAAVTHGDVIFFLLLWARGIAVTPENRKKGSRLPAVEEFPVTGSITTLTYASDDEKELPDCTYINPENDGNTEKKLPESSE